MATYRKVTTAKGEERWEYQVRKRGVQRTGRARTKEAAKGLARKAEDEIDLFRIDGIADKTVADAIDQYLKTELDGHAPSDRRNLTQRLGWWKSTIGAVRLRDLRPNIIRAAWDRLEAASGTKNRYLANLAKVLRVASQEWEWLPTNPARALRKRREGPGRVRMLDDTQRTKLMDACRADVNTARLYPMVLFALRTGCRKGEIEALRVADVDAAGKQAWIARSKNGVARFVHLHDEVLAAIVAATAKPRPDGRVFGNLPKWAWERVREAAGLEDWTFHDLRHDFASRLGRRGLSAPQIAAALGHKSWVMSARYTHSSSSDARDIIRSLD